jgi:hypothetical protein
LENLGAQVLCLKIPVLSDHAQYLSTCGREKAGEYLVIYGPCTQCPQPTWKKVPIATVDAEYCDSHGNASVSAVFLRISDMLSLGSLGQLITTAFAA